MVVFVLHVSRFEISTSYPEPQGDIHCSAKTAVTPSEPFGGLPWRCTSGFRTLWGARRRPTKLACSGLVGPCRARSRIVQGSWNDRSRSIFRMLRPSRRVSMTTQLWHVQD